MRKREATIEIKQKKEEITFIFEKFLQVAEFFELFCLICFLPGNRRLCGFLLPSINVDEPEV